MADPLTHEPDRLTGTAALLERLARPFDAARVVAALVGLPQRASRQLVGSVLATSEEAETLLDRMPRIVRSLAIATTDRPERCYGELRGPVLWSETVSGRAASAGDPGLYVCATTTKAYDTVENRVLKAALAAIERAGHDASLGGDAHGRDRERMRRARQNELRARHLLEHRTLAAVPVTRVSGRAIRRTRAGSRRATYHPAVALLLRAQDPVRAEHLAPWITDATAADHALLAAVLDALEERPGGAPPLRTSSGSLVAGAVRYEHLAGVSVGGVLVRSIDELDEALERAGA